MKTSAEKSSSAAKSTTASPFFAKAGGGDFFAPAIQTKLKVGQPGDKLEQEADRTADRVMRMPAPMLPMKEERTGTISRKEMDDKPIQRMAKPDEKLQRKEEEKIQKKEDEKLQRMAMPEQKLQRKEEEKLQRKGDGVPAVTSNIQSGISNKMSGGQPIDTNTRSFMESRMNADFSNVRIHSDAESGSLNNQLSARAFTYQNHVFFNHDQYQPGTSEGKHLLAHELTHTVQQGYAVQRAPQVSTTATQPQIQRLGIGDALDYFADAAYNIPGYRMFTIVIGVNPINMERADRSTANILRAIVEFLPGGRLITSVLDRYQVFERAGAYVEEQLNSLGITGASIRAAVMSFLDSLGWRDIFNLGGVWDRARRIFTEPIGRILTLIRNLGQRLMQFIWDAVLRPLASLAEGTRGWDLVKAILGRDPITGDPFPRTPATLIGGFMRLIGQEEVWENIQRGGAIQRAWVWFQTALSELMGFIGQIPTLFINTLRSIEIADFLPPTVLFGRIFRVFGNFVGSFISWAGSKVLNLLEIIFSVVAPGAMPYLRRAAGAFRQIIRAPGSFVRNLINAVLQGFRGFASRIGTHLRNSIVQWLTGAMAGAAIYIPRAFELREIVKFVLSVLGLTWQNLRGRLVRHIGEPAVAALETTVSVVRTLITEGPAAAWEQIREMLGNLRDMVMTQVMQYVSTTIVQAAMTRLLTSLNPVGAFIQAIIAIYNTVMFLIERISQIIQVGRSVLDSIMAIAAGNIGAAAQRVEQTMAGLLTTVISFLARIAGLGRISDAVVGIINRIRRPIDAAMDRVVNWLMGMARRFVVGVAGAVSNWFGIRKPFTGRDSQSHTLYFQGRDSNAVEYMASRPRPVNEFLNEVLSRPGVTSAQRTSVNTAREILTNIRRIKRENPQDASVQIQQKFNDLAAILAELTASDEIFDPIPAIRTLPDGFDVRNDLYINGSGFGSRAASLRTSGKNTVANQIIEFKNTGNLAIWNRLAADGQVIETNAEKMRYLNMPDASIRQDVSNQNFDVDHTTALARHWVNMNGNDASDSERHEKAGSPSNLKLMLAYYNRQAGADGFQYRQKFFVGPNFTSTYNNSIRGSKKIKGQLFK